MLPLLMSVLAMPISLSAALFAGVSGMLFIIAADFARFSDVHFIIAAEAGVKAKAESIAAAINVLIANLAWKANQRIAGFHDTYSPPDTFPEEDIFVCCAAARARQDGPLRAGSDADDDLAVGLVRFHQSMGVADFLKPEDFRGLGLVGPRGDSTCPAN